MEDVLSGTYEPDKVEVVEILKKNGKKRKISKYICADRVLQDVLMRYLESLWESVFSNQSFAYGKDKGSVEAVV